MRRLLALALSWSVVLCWSGFAAAQGVPARVMPESVLTGEPPGLAALTLVGSRNASIDLTRTAVVLVGDQKVVPAVRDATSVTFLPPRSEIAGEVAVQARDDKGATLASGTMRYVSASGAGYMWLAVLYVVVILGFPFVLMFYDLRRAYRFARETRKMLIEKAAGDGLSAEELKLLLAELSQSPPGIPGLARNSIAFMLMMILGVAIVHILAVDPPGGKDIPASIDRILVLLTGLLTSVVSFYFGSKAAESAQQSARMSVSDTASKPAAPTFVPKSGKRGDRVTISGAGFGADKGTVLFGSTAADLASAKWTDREIVVPVPADAPAGKTLLTVVPKGTDRKLVSATEFEVLAAGAAPGGGADAQGVVDGCDVDITDATPDRDLPRAEGGVQR
jgi:hypothetical protein